MVEHTEGIAERLDRFLLHTFIYERIQNLKTWNSYLGTSDHAAIFLEWSEENDHIALPFKFNHTWLEDKYFVELVNK